MNRQAFRRIVAGVKSTLVVAGMLRVAGPFRVNYSQARTSHLDHRGVHQLVALLAAGLLLAACVGNGRSTGSPPVAPDHTATTMATTVPPPPKAPTTTLPRSPLTATTADRLAAQLTTAETAIRDPATPAGKLPTLGRSQQQAYRAWSCPGLTDRAGGSVRLPEQ